MVKSSAPVQHLSADSAGDRFERTIVPLLDAAYTLARHILRDEHDAQDAVQEAYLRAWRHFSGFRGEDGRAWLLTIVRNCCYTWRRTRGRAAQTVEFREEEHADVAVDQAAPDAALLEDSDRSELWQALGRLSPEFREAIVLREIEGMSYDAIARVIGAPIGTVMSRLSRARRRLQEVLEADHRGEEVR